MNDRAPLEQRESFLICTWSCSAAGYDPTVCAQYGCQALRHNKGEPVARSLNDALMDESAAQVGPPASMAIPKMGSSIREPENLKALRSVSMPLDELEKALISARDRIQRDASNVRTLADRLFGAEPESEGANKALGRSGRLGNLQDAAEYVHNTISELEHQLDRLAPLIGN